MLAEDFAQVIYSYIQNGINKSFNVAPDNRNLSIDEYANIALKACDAEELSIVYDSSKSNGQLRKDVDTSILKESLPNFKFIDLEDGIKNIYNHYTKDLHA